MYKTTGLKNSRIEVADALRGLAVAGIILFHSVEHFNTFAREIKYTLPCDGTVFSVLQALLSGKMYGIFAVLFGLSFFIMRDNQEQKGKDFSLRFAWRMVLLFLFGTVPFLISGMSFIDSFFESVSGFTTTGATIITDVEATDRGLLLWRAITNWIGGIIIVMMFMFIIPMVVSGGRGLLKNEMSGSGGGNLTVKLGSAAKQFIAMYIILTAIFTLILYIQNLTLLDSVTIAMSSISIGGFLNTNDSMASYSMFVKKGAK